MVQGMAYFIPCNHLHPLHAVPAFVPYSAENRETTAGDGDAMQGITCIPCIITCTIPCM